MCAGGCIHRLATRRRPEPESSKSPLVKTRDFEADWISTAPGEKTKTVFYADDRVFWVVESGQMRINIEGQAPFVATKGFLVQAAPRLAYSLETAGNEPVLRFEVRPAGEMPSYPITETPVPVKGWTFIKSRERDVVQANAGSSNFVWDGHTAAHIIRGKGIDAASQQPRALPREHGRVVDRARGQLDLLIEGEPLVTGTVGDVVQAPNDGWHRATFHGNGMATRLAITPRNKEGQVHYWQPDAQADRQRSVLRTAGGHCRCGFEEKRING